MKERIGESPDRADAVFYLATETKLNQSVFQEVMLEQKIVTGGEIALYDEIGRIGQNRWAVAFTKNFSQS